MTSRISLKKNIVVGGCISLQDIALFLNGVASVNMGKEVLARVAKSKKHLEDTAVREIIYGINTGFGPLARTYIHPSKQCDLQYNLIRSHAVGQGAPLDQRFVRVMMLLRLHTLAQGYSGVSPEILYGLKNFIEKGIVPVVFEHGSVGASGDLVQLAHIALALIGEGEVFMEGKRVKTSVALKKHSLKPVPLSGRDGLALINGTSAMTAISAINLIEGEHLVDLALTSSALLMEIVGANIESIHPIVSQMRPHTGQSKAAQMMNTLLKGSKHIRHTTYRTLPGVHSEDTSPIENTVQEIYSLRCVPQIIGPVADTLVSAKKIIETEINSVTDNPIVSSDDGIFHSGNFHGDYVALEMDKFKIAITKLSLLLERQLNFLCNPRLNGVLPPFVTMGTPGLDLGMQGLQFVATSTAAENQALSTPMSIHTISTNNDNQDIVSMGTNAALMASRVVENTYQIQAILFATLLQAVDFLGIKSTLGKGTKNMYQTMRRIFPFFKKDYPFLAKDIAELSLEIRKNAFQRYQQP
ncbi:MAG: aromatic amino acid ammonia-lyase [bacterium]|nr:aromatic amino acid ammonia-lyase [bacterium]MDO8741920.1 aromatic amino acid ammonia-lyase [bacterium]